MQGVLETRLVERPEIIEGTVVDSKDLVPFAAASSMDGDRGCGWHVVQSVAKQMETVGCSETGGEERFDFVVV